jgi:mono/diheme cytochrome c family protein
MVRSAFALVLVFCLAGRPLPAQPAAGVVTVEICEEGVPKDATWPTDAKVTERHTEDVFGLFELPHKYISTGVRADRAFPSLVRASATVTLPQGRHRILLRSRGPARLMFDGRTVLETPFDHARIYTTLRAVGGEVLFTEQDKYLNLGPDFRFAPPGNRETWATLEFTGAPQTVVLETLIGVLEPRSKTPFRPELGETVAAVSLEGTETWFLLSPGTRTVRYNDEGWNAYEAERRLRLEAINTAARAARRAEHAGYWNRRRDAAQAYLAATREEPVPALPRGFPAHNAIDHFLAARIAQVAADYDPKAAKPGSVDFHRDIKPLFEAKCYQCHQGAKVKGGLRLDLRAEALLGGNADGPALVPHEPDKSPLLKRVLTTDEDERMPAASDPLAAADVALLRRWIAEGAVWPDFARQRLELTPPADDLTFLRRVTLDTIGLVPTEAEIAAFRADRSPDRRTKVIDRLLNDPRWADQWMGYWMDVLAENPNLINPTLNNTGPFRWWLYESLRDNKPLDLFVTELLRLEGSDRFGGPAGFGVASQNDVPMAAKGVIISSAFLGVEMKCARCHDSPTHTSKQKELFSLAALLAQKPVKVPTTSSVPMDHLTAGGRKALVEVTLPPGSEVAPAWPFAAFCDEQTAATIAEQPDNTRDRLAALITAPQNERFAQVMANRIWERFMGRGIVESPGDWEKSSVSHPELLRWLARELVRAGYDVKALARLILTSHAYQRAVDPELSAPSPLHTAPAPRRIGAEQLVDSLFAATGKPFAVEPVVIDLDSARPINVSIDLGIARRAWMLGSTSNERDRPSLALPRNQAIGEVLEVFGWRAERPDAIGGPRRVEGNVLQPALIANGTMMSWLVRLSDDHGLTRLVLEDQPVETLVERLYLRLLTRPPTAREKEHCVSLLKPGYASRAVEAPPPPAPNGPRTRPKYVSWSNHMSPEANLERVEQTAVARRGEPPTARLDPAWRERFEDVLWALLNAPEWTHVM